MNIKPFSHTAITLDRGIYQHYKGNLYKILYVGRCTETLEEVVIYQALYGDNDIWVRPLTMFLEEVTINNAVVPRFTLIEPQP
jgi:hypothetical protein